MDDVILLAIVYRSRPATVAELRELAHHPDDQVDAALARLENRGLLGRRGERLTYPHPATWLSQTVAAELDGVRRRSSDALARIDDLVAALPERLREWAVGESAAEVVPVLVRHGPRAAEELWYDTAGADGGETAGVFPDVARFLTTDPERRAQFSQAFGGKESVRAILPSSVRGMPAVVAIAERYELAGVRFRTLDAPPGWFWVDGDVVAVPFEWGEGWPSSVLGVRNAALAALGRALFDELWRRAEPVSATAAPWDALLRLMRTGLTLDAASRSLGINPRTGRRRVAAAMEHYGVSTLFALGVAWGSGSEQQPD